MRRILLLLISSLTVHFADSQRICGSVDYRQQLIHNTPGLTEKIAAIEAFTRNIKARSGLSIASADTTRSGLSIINIPVVVHVIYHTSSENINDAQVASQIEVLNQDYRRQNADTAETPSCFQPVAADCGFRFVLAKVDPHGYATKGIVRKQTTVAQFSINDNIKFSSSGGDDGWDPDNYFNIWVGNLTGGVLGYSSVVGGPRANDGIVVSYSAFGTLGAATAPFNEGRTATHETGHWLNLIHTWGDADCGDDKVADTPPQQAAEYGCPSGIIVTCNDGPNGEMYTNYMDFTNDACMNIFTIGQRERMRALFEPGGVRYGMLASTALAANALPDTSSTLDESSDMPLISAYPNPTRGTVNISLSDESAVGMSLIMYNELGQQVLNQRVPSLHFQINIGGLNNGIYYLRVGGSVRNIAKLVKF